MITKFKTLLHVLILYYLVQVNNAKKDLATVQKELAQISKQISQFEASSLCVLEHEIGVKPRKKNVLAYSGLIDGWIGTTIFQTVTISLGFD
jgi:hypothetical protein